MGIKDEYRDDDDADVSTFQQKLLELARESRLFFCFPFVFGEQEQLLLEEKKTFNKDDISTVIFSLLEIFSLESWSWVGVFVYKIDILNQSMWQYFSFSGTSSYNFLGHFSTGKCLDKQIALLHNGFGFFVNFIHIHFQSIQLIRHSPGENFIFKSLFRWVLNIH